MCDGYQLPKIVQDAAKEVYKLVYEERPLKGKSQETIMASAIFIGCRMAKVARSFKEIWALTNVLKNEIGKVFKKMEKIIKEKNSSNPNSAFIEYDIKASQTTAEGLIRRFCSHLGLNTQVANAAEYIARRCNEVDVLSGRSPVTIAATVIYMATLMFGTDLLPSKIANKTGVSDGTIKTSYKVMYEEKEKLINPYWIESSKIQLDKIPKN